MIGGILLKQSTCSYFSLFSCLCTLRSGRVASGRNPLTGLVSNIPLLLLQLLENKRFFSLYQFLAYHVKIIRICYKTDNLSVFQWLPQGYWSQFLFLTSPKKFSNSTSFVLFCFVFLFVFCCRCICCLFVCLFFSFPILLLETFRLESRIARGRLRGLAIVWLFLAYSRTIVNPGKLYFLLLPDTLCCPVSGRYQYPDTWNKNSIFEAPFSVLGKRSISNESWTFQL